ncbi:TPA: bifunctional folylpolyglutamate synthase/dihydrofolate synthase, partial [Listeria monocytogenes]|nr:bifunctional folylpolyglutamate synthase/dihydrofolate synthase [Listeria monocytogenes]
EVIQIGKNEGISLNPDWQQALNNLYETETNTKIFITGSLYFISEVRKYLLASIR